ncbi:MAG: hypothetical protein KDD82_28870, partial [Planctomycetes bacterium]|nr:hypothetical protein [Planctomycetota bacterium]
IALAVVAGLGFVLWLLFSAVGGADRGFLAAAPMAETSARYAGGAAGADYASDGADYEYEATQATDDDDYEERAYRSMGQSKGAPTPAPMAPPPPPEAAAPRPSRPQQQAAPERRLREAKKEAMDELQRRSESLSQRQELMEKSKDKADSNFAPAEEPMADPSPADMPATEDEPMEADALDDEADGSYAFGDDAEGGESGGDADAYGGRGRVDADRAAGGKLLEARKRPQPKTGERANNEAKPVIVLEEEVQLDGELRDLARRYANGPTGGAAGGGGQAGSDLGGLNAPGNAVTLDVGRIDSLVEQNADDPTLRLLRAKLRSAQGDLNGALQDAERSVQLRGGPAAYKAQGEILRALGREEEAEVAFTRQKFMERSANEAGRSSGKTVGLSSLVLGWTPVGRRYAFSRDGGGAELGLELTRTGALVTAFGMLALIGCALGLVLPLVTRTHVLAVLVVGLGVLSALPLLVLPAKFVPVCNALALGLVCAAPIQLAWALAKAWDKGPLTRLGKAMRAERLRRRGLRPGASAL